MVSLFYGSMVLLLKTVRDFFRENGERGKCAVLSYWRLRILVYCFFEGVFLKKEKRNGLRPTRSSLIFTLFLKNIYLLLSAIIRLN